jgi:hypothetical protein
MKSKNDKKKLKKELKQYKRIKELGIEISHDETCDVSGVTIKNLHSALKKNKLDSELFSKLFGVQTCPVVNGKSAMYPWDVEAVLERMMSGKLTGTQLLWD